MQAKNLRTESQIVFNDDEGTVHYKSLYLDTLGAQAVRRSFADRAAYGASISSLPVEGYAHGMGTADISGASPAVHSLTRAAAARQYAGKHLQDSSDAQPAAAAAGAGAGAANGSSDNEADAGMRPRVRHPQTVNRPDLTHSTLDIDGAQPHCRNIFRNPRQTDPLNPCYKLSDSPTLPLPTGPAPADKCLGDPLDVTDIPGAARRQQRPCSRPGQLDVSDIEGANAAWRPHHRQQLAVQPRDAGLAVGDINGYMARFRPAPRASADKGHPDGPKLEPRVKPRHCAGLMDNSLRTDDIEGTRAVSADMRVRQPHNHTTSVADIEGAAPADRDKVHLFERKRAAAASVLADHAAAQAVLSGLQLRPEELAALWGNCSKRDKDGSGYLTAKELEGAMQAAQLQLSAGDAQRLLAALQDNAGLLNYKKLTKQLKGRVSRPGTAQHVPSNTACQQQLPQQQEQAATHKNTLPLQDATPAVAVEHDSTPEASSSAGLHVAEGTADAEPAAGALCAAGDAASGLQQCQQRVRPKTAPPRACSATAGTHVAVAGSSSSDGYKVISHWFGGSSRDTSAVEGVAK